ncbi:hypothetical protein EYF80_004522 [Liparis tanakae]|uniref:Uncharacterized protein n=1 Tax=Liparis tanakae TaxID=230148 RepID=A0A4Z2J6T8_9TELE|nr:hypothetical protein EYF80_004522 [Liparis tanakae]
MLRTEARVIVPNLRRARLLLGYVVHVNECPRADGPSAGDGTVAAGRRAGGTKGKEPGVTRHITPQLVSRPQRHNGDILYQELLRGWRWGGGRWRHHVCNNIKLLEENRNPVVPLGCGVENKINGPNKGRSDYFMREKQPLSFHDLLRTR